MDLKFPYQFNNLGQTAQTSYEEHIRMLIEQVLFTSPGERVNRPDFGSGLLKLVFEPNSTEMAATTQFLVQGSLQQWLGHLIEVNAVQVNTIDSVLEVVVSYTIRSTQQNFTVQFSS
jgi:phage baseplate assembly protein W